jgi:hypothetical protein
MSHNKNNDNTTQGPKFGDLSAQNKDRAFMVQGFVGNKVLEADPNTLTDGAGNSIKHTREGNKTNLEIEIATPDGPVRVDVESIRASFQSPGTLFTRPTTQATLTCPGSNEKTLVTGPTAIQLGVTGGTVR